MEKRKKIAFILPDLFTGGMPRCMETLSIGLQETEYKQSIILLKDKPVNFDVCGEVTSLAPEGKGWFAKALIFLVRMYRLRKIFKKNKFDCIITYGMTASCICLIVNQGLKGKVILTEHNVKSVENRQGKTRMSNFVNEIYDRMMRRLYNKADCIVPVSEYIGYDLSKHYGVEKKRIHCIYNGADTDRINRMSREKISLNEEEIFSHHTIVNVGALSAQKGQWHLIRIMPLIRESISDAQLVILGTGDYIEKLSRLIESLGLSNCVHLLGAQSNPYKYLAQAEVFALSSIYEGFPNVLVEAMALNLPIVSVDCKSGPRELLTEKADITVAANKVIYGEYGILTPPFTDGSYEADKAIDRNECFLAEAIIEIIRNTRLRKQYQQISEKRILSFNGRKMAEDYKELLDMYCM